MNFVALIGIVNEVKPPIVLTKSGNVSAKNPEIITVEIKIEKPFVETNDEDWYELVQIKLDCALFKAELRSMKKGDIIGIKGRLQTINGLTVIGERLQVF